MSDNLSHVGVEDEKAIDNVDHGSETDKDKEAGSSAEEFRRDKNGKNQSMQVKVYSPFRDYYDGQAFSLSAENLTGPFDILPQHHNFISLLTPCEISIRTAEAANKPPVRFRISGGILHVKADEVVVFLDV